MTITWQAIGVIIAILSHAGFMIWWASKLTARMDTVRDSLIHIDRELEKRDSQMAAMWKKVDSMSERLIVIETKTGLRTIERKDL